MLQLPDDQCAVPVSSVIDTEAATQATLFASPRLSNKAIMVQLDQPIRSYKAAQVEAKRMHHLIQAQQANTDVQFYMQAVLASDHLDIVLFDAQKLSVTMRANGVGRHTGGYDQEEHTIYFDFAVVKDLTDHDYTILINHEFWHAYNTLCNRLIDQEGALKYLSAPFRNKESYHQVQSYVAKGFERIHEASKLLGKINKGHKLTSRDKKGLGIMQKVLSGYVNPTLDVCDEETLRSHGLFDVSVGDIVLEKYNAIMTIVKIEHAQDGKPLYWYQAADQFNAFILTMHTIKAHVSDRYRTLGPLVNLVEMDCYIHTSIPPRVRSYFFPELEAFHDARKEHYQQANKLSSARDVQSLPN